MSNLILPQDILTALGWLCIALLTLLVALVLIETWLVLSILVQRKSRNPEATA